MKTTQKFAANYATILLEDDAGRQGVFDMVEFSIKPSGEKWDERWYALSASFQALFEWQGPLQDIDEDEPSFDPS